MKNSHKNGFTLIEVAVIIPIVLLTIGAVIGLILKLTTTSSSVEKTSKTNYDIESALNQLDNDINLSDRFLVGTDNVSIVAPQGSDNGTANFYNYSTNSNQNLILEKYATTQPEDNTNHDLIYTRNYDGTCTGSPLHYYVVYFVKNNSLYRRVILPSNYATTGCSTPYQLPSCQSNQAGSVCKATDELIIGNLAANTGFTINYYDSSTNDLTSSTNNLSATVATRQTAMDKAITAKITITTTNPTDTGTTQKSRLNQ